MVFTAESDYRISIDPAVIAKQAAQENFSDNSISASAKEGHYGEESWLRDLVEYFGDLSHANQLDLKMAGWALDHFLSTAPFVPYKYSPINHTLKYVGIKKANSNHIDRQLPIEKQLFNMAALRGEYPYVADTFLILKLAAAYMTTPKLDHGKQVEFWQTHREHLKSYFEELTNPDSPFLSPNWLIDQAPFTSRADCIGKSGNEFMTNVNWYMTLESLANAVGGMYDIPWSRELYEIADKVKHELNEKFWDAKLGHYYDWIDRKGNVYDYLDSKAHCWAILSGIADTDKAKKIIEYMLDHNVYREDVGLVATVDKPYDPSLFSWEFRAMGEYGWYNGGEHCAYWPEITAMLAAAAQKTGYHELAAKLKTSIEELLIRQGTLHETYDSNRNPIDMVVKILRILTVRYKSPRNFLMALGDSSWLFENSDKLLPNQKVI